MLSRALKFSLRGGICARAASALPHQAGRVDDWENFKMPGAPYADMGPLPPPPAKEQVSSMTRMTFIPESFFKMLEPRTGHCGPYILLWGGFATCLSKEWLPLTAETWWTMGAVVFYSFMINNLVAPWADREDTIFYDERHSRISAWKDYKIGLASSEVDGIAQLKEQTSGLSLVQEQRRINLELAIDAEHMNRQADLTEAVKKRLDYQVAVTNAEREAMTKHMISWIDREVASAIEKRSAKDDLAAAIAQLKGMAKTA